MTKKLSHATLENWAANQANLAAKEAYRINSLYGKGQATIQMKRDAEVQHRILGDLAVIAERYDECRLEGVVALMEQLDCTLDLSADMRDRLTCKLSSFHEQII